ncbi:MAG: D-aminoacylase [Actinomyces sp.]|nr:MAG: D-aminoacylase [Actinomyces sp.]
MHDLIIRGGLLVDGSGAPARHADVAVDGDRITAVTDPGDRDLGRARRVIEAEGAVVTPGFVDVHTHYDAQVTWDPELTPSSWHGVTTVVMGNCGVGFAPVRPTDHQRLIELMEGVEDIPGAAMHEGISWEWETFEEYLDALERRRWMLDVGTQLPHGALRAYVMGDRATGPADADDIAAMAAHARRALEAGALGVSTSRTPLHRSIDGELVPGTTADASELLALAGAIAAAGHGVFQCAIHHPEVPASFAWLRQVAAVTGGPVVFNLNQPDVAPDLWRTDLALCEEAARDGLRVLAQVAGRPVGILQCWEATVHPFVACPTWREITRLPEAERRARLADPDVRRRLVTEEPDPVSRFQHFVTRTWEKLWVFDDEADYEPDPADSLAARAAREGRSPAELAYDHLCAHEGRGLLYFPLFNYANHDLDHLWELHRHPCTRMGLADAGAHCGAIADGGMPTFMLQYWARDRQRGPRLDLEWVVHRQTRQTAELYGLDDRGLVAPGLRADLNVIDLEALSVERPRLAHDLPTGARRYVQRASGYRATVCAGEVTVGDDEPTGAVPGRLIRGPQRH